MNLGITFVQFGGGLVANSLALISDAVHNLSDSSSLGVSLVARRISRRQADRRNTFGYRRAEIIGAFVNLIVLVLVALFLVREGIERLLQPEAIDGLLMFIIAGVGLFGNVVSVVLLHADSKHSLNIKSAYTHLLWDAIGSVAVILGGVLVMAFGWYVVDPIITIAVAFYILWTSYGMLKETVGILMEAASADTDVTGIRDALEGVDSVQDVHHIHVWNLDEHETLLECHVRIAEQHVSALERIKADVKAMLEQKFGITHSTIEFELTPCGEQRHEA